MLDVISLLTGDEAYPPLLDSMLETFVSKMRLRLETALWACNDIEGGVRSARLADAYDRLSDAGRLRLLLSPALFELLGQLQCSRSEVALAALSDFIDCEHILEFGTTASGKVPNEKIWSATGDVAAYVRDGSFELQRCEKLDGLITVDFDSIHAKIVRPLSPLMYLEPDVWLDDERACVDAKLRGALEYVDEVAPVFGRLIRNYTRAIRLRKSNRVDGFSAEHVTDTIGELRLLNTHSPALTVYRMAESLVHESVHNLLSTYEFIEGAFVLVPDDRQYRPVSPWTGNPIPVASFCHAILVWYALFHFAMCELKRPGLGDVERAEILARRNRYANGFLAHPLADSLRGLLLYSEALLPTFEFAQSVVRGRCVSEQSSTSADEVAA